MPGVVAVIGGVDDQCVVQLACRFQFRQHPPDLAIDAAYRRVIVRPSLPLGLDGRTGPRNRPPVTSRQLFVWNVSKRRILILVHQLRRRLVVRAVRVHIPHKQKERLIPVLPILPTVPQELDRSIRQQRGLRPHLDDVIPLVRKILRPAVRILIRPVAEPPVKPRVRLMAQPAMPLPHQCRVIPPIPQQLRNQCLVLQSRMHQVVMQLLDPVMNPML